MDEAEYCARIGLMVAGKLVALDSPKALKQQWVPGKVIALHDQELQKVRDRLRSVSGILAIEPFGASVHVRFDEALLSAKAIAQRVAQDNRVADLAFEPAEVSLEDVFLAVVTQESPKQDTQTQDAPKQDTQTQDTQTQGAKA
jgi:ABC-2 type transport system ATP-binding protein